MPIHAPIQAQRRLASLGEIRVGEKAVTSGGKEYPRSRSTYRFTSRHRHLLEKLQSAHGGEVRPWAGKPGHFELLSECSSLPALFSLKPLDGGDCESLVRYFESRDKEGKLVRKCDGHQCMTWRGKDRVAIECPCRSEGQLSCKIRGRVSVILPDVPDFGCWSLSTQSTTFENEAQAFIENMRQMAPELTIVPVVLTLTKRYKETAPGEKAGSFPVVTISRDHNPKPLAQLAHEVRSQLMAPIPQGLGELPVSPAPALEASIEATTGEVVTGDLIPPVKVQEVVSPSPEPASVGLSDFEWFAERVGLDVARDIVTGYQSKNLNADLMMAQARKHDASAERIMQNAREALEGGK